MGWPTVTLPDAEGAIRSWLRAVGVGAAGDRIFFAIPDVPADQGGLVYPLVTLSRAGGGPADELPIDAPLMLFNVWADSKRDAAEAAAALIALLRMAAGSVRTDQMTVDDVTTITGPVWQPDEDAHKARYIVTAAFTLRPAMVSA